MSAPLTTDALWLALAGEFRAGVEAAVGSALTTSVAPVPADAGWGTPITASGRVEGTLTVWVDEAGVNAIARAMMGVDDKPEPSVASDLLKQLWAQAVAALVLKQAFEGVTLVAGPTTAGTLPTPGDGQLLTQGATTLAMLAMTGEVAASRVAAGPPPASGPATGAGPADYPGNLAALLDIDLPLVVRFARTEMSLRALAQLGPGSMVDMGRSPDAPVQLVIGSRVVAEGEVVVVAGNYGVRITSLVSPADRLRAMEL